MEEERLKNFGMHIRELRESQGMSQEELAKKSGFAGRAAISAIEKGKNNISVDRIPDLAEALNTTPIELTEVLFNEPSSFISVILIYLTSVFLLIDLKAAPYCGFWTISFDNKIVWNWLLKSLICEL